MKKLNFTQRIFLILVLSISAIFINSYALVCNITSFANHTQFAEDNYGSTSISIKNGKFTSHQSQGKGLPDKVDDWTVADNVITDKTVSGIISVDDSNWSSTKYNYLPDNPEKPGNEGGTSSFDNYILAIASKGTDGENISTRYGYKSSGISLSNDKFYAVRIFCKTTNNAIASIYTSLSASTDPKTAFLNINTNNNWEEYYFLIATNSFDSYEDFQIELRLGGSRNAESSGAVFFDQVEITEIANKDFNSANTNNFNIIKYNLDNDDYIPSFKNANFENGLEGYQVEKNNTDAERYVNVYKAGDIKNRLSTFFDVKDDNIAWNNTSTGIDYNENDNQELLIMNIDATSSIIKTTEDNTLKVEQNGFYRLSMLIKTGDLSSSGLNITLSNLTTIIAGQDKITKTQSGLTSSNGGAYNGFTRVDFYIRGNAWMDCELELSIALGSEETGIKGWAIIDNITLQKISGSEYTKGSDSNQINLSSNITNTSNITNGNFDFVTSSVSTISYPAAPQDWTASSNINNNNSNSGIIRVRKDYFDKDCLSYGLYSNQNPGPDNSTVKELNSAQTFSNVLMVRNKTTEDVYFKSTPPSNVSLSANTASSSTIVKISVSVKTFNDSAKAFIRVFSGDNEDVIASIDNISAKDWTNYTIYIKNGIATKNINLVLGTHGSPENDDETVKGNYAFFDNVNYNSNYSNFNLENYIKSKTQLQTENNEYKNSIYVDLLENGFYNHSSNIVDGNKYIFEQNSMLVHQSGKTAQYNGILDTTVNENVKVRKDALDKNVLVITNKTAGVQVLKTIDTYSLVKDNYYEFSVWIKTDISKELNNFGAYFELVQVDDEGNIIKNSNNTNKFANIIIDDEEENNGWVKYSMYVLAETNQNVKVLLGLGNEENEVKGSVYFDDLKITETNETEYSSIKQNSTTLVSKVIPAPQEDTDNNTTDNSNNQNSDINIWALLSSIILVIALILAIVGYSIRKIPKRKIAKRIKASDYEKSPFAVDEDEIKRELNASRKLKIETLNKDIEALQNSKEELNATYNKDIENLTDEKEINKIQVKHTKEINKVDKQIAYLQSALIYITDPINMRNEERQIINDKKKQAKEEFIKLKQEELEKELASQEEQEEPETKNKKNKYKKHVGNSKNKSKK